MNPLGAFFYRIPCCEHTNRRHKSGQQNQPERDAVNAEMVAYAKPLNPSAFLLKLHLRRTCVKPGIERYRHSKGE